MVGPVNSLSAARADYPDGSMSQLLLDRCLEAAVARGVDVSAPYEPWLPVDMMQTLLLQVHDALGCSWLAAIVMACVGIRAITLPISVSAIRGSREKALIQPEFVRLTEKQQQLSADGDQEKMAENNKKLQAFQQKHGKFFMLKGTGNLILVQMPLYITAVTAMRGFASHPDVFRSFAMESPLWLDSLALADPYALLPMTTAAIMITNTELFGSIDTEVAQSQQAPSAFTEAMGQGTFQKYQKWIMRSAAIMFVPMMWNFPAGVFVFMSTNMILSTIQNRLLRLPVFERLLEIPPPPERHAEAAAAAAAAGPPALLPISRALREARKVTLPIGAPHGAPLRPALGAEGDLQRGAPKGPVTLAASMHAEIDRGGPARAGGEEAPHFGASPRYSVRRARPARPGLA